MESKHSESKRVDEILLSYVADLNNIGKYLGATYDNSTEKARTAILAELAKAREYELRELKIKYLEEATFNGNNPGDWLTFIDHRLAQLRQPQEKN